MAGHGSELGVAGSDAIDRSLCVVEDVATGHAARNPELLSHGISSRSPVGRGTRTAQVEVAIGMPGSIGKLSPA